MSRADLRDPMLHAAAEGITTAEHLRWLSYADDELHRLRQAANLPTPTSYAAGMPVYPTSTTTVYDGSFDLAFLSTDEFIRSAGDGSAAVIVAGPWGSVRAQVGDRVSRTRLGHVVVLPAPDTGETA